MNKLEQAARQAFETWWEREGQEFLYALNTTTDDDIKLVAEVAWKNGAYCAEQTEGAIVKTCPDGYGTITTEQAEQEPVAFIGQGLKPIVPEDLEKLRKHEPGTATLYDTSLYAAPVRTKDLTNDEIEAIMVEQGDLQTIAFARAIIAADREKNK